jgi:group I intron endonuclease
MYTYIATNTLNGKFYIGSTVNFQERKAAHLRSKENYPFQNALKANPEAFEWEVWSDHSQDRELEQALLDMWFGKEQCYNLNPVVSGPPCFEWTEERRKAAGNRARERGTDHLRTPEAISKMKETKRNNPTVYTEEMRAARSQMLLGNTRKKGKKESPETCKKKSEAFTGVPKPAQSKAMLGRTWWLHPDGRRKFQVKSPGAEWINSYGKRKN